jgi:redox-sensitive bicupin YhaK (pirin superfamily)
LDVRLDTGASIELPAPAGESTFAYVVEGSVASGDRIANAPQLLIFSDGEGATVKALTGGSRFLFVSALPVKEPVLQFRSLVMNTVEDIRETLDMIEDGTFGR